MVIGRITELSSGGQGLDLISLAREVEEAKAGHEQQVLTIKNQLGRIKHLEDLLRTRDMEIEALKRNLTNAS